MDKNTMKFCTGISIVLMFFALFAWGVRPSQANDATNWEYHTPSNGLPLESIVSINEDAEGNLWVGSLLAGAAMFDGQDWTVLNRDNGLIENTVQTIAFDNDVTFFGHWQSGMTILANGRQSFFRNNADLQSGNVRNIVVMESGEIWIGHAATSSMMSGGGVTHITSNSAETFDFVGDTTSNAIADIVADEDENVWFGVSDYITQIGTQIGGLVKFDGTDWTTYAVVDGLPSTDVRALAVDGSTIWVGTAEGVSAFDGKAWATYTSADGLLSNDIHDIAIDANGTVWTVSPNGVNQFANGEWTTLTSTDGLLDDIVTTIETDSAGNLLFISESGISRMTVQPAEAPAAEYQLFLPIITN